MRNLLPLFSLCILLLVSCTKEQKPTASADKQVATESPLQRGKQMLQSSDCLSCHKVEGRLIGPSYTEIANKYTEKDIDVMAQRIIDGSVGIWGNAAMTPHIALSKEDAILMVRYILSLKKQP